MEDFDSLGEVATCSATLVNDLEKFVYCMYVKANFTSVNKLRYMFSQNYQCTSGHVLSSFYGTDLSLLPPCRASLEMHTCRANYQAFIWGHAHKQFPNVPSPEGYDWKIDEEGSIDYEWKSSFIVPQELIDILCTEPSNDTSEEEGLTTEVDNMIDVVYENESDDDDT